MIDYGLEDKICLVTGSSRGIGKSIVDAFIQQKARVIIVSRQPGAHLKSDNCYVYNTNLMDSGEVSSVCGRLIEEVGIPDVVVHNLGGSYQVTSDLAKMEQWVDVWRFNLGISIEFNEILFPLFLKHKKTRRLIHISSSAVKTLSGYAPYIAAKASVEAYVKTLALRYAQHDILINAVAPGAVSLPGRYFAELKSKNPSEFHTFLQNHIALRRLAEPEEVAAVVLFLASKQATYITGSIIEVDGGMR